MQQTLFARWSTHLLTTALLPGMARPDRIKEAIGWLKVVFVSLVAVDVSLIAWLAQNFHSADTVLVVLAFGTVVCTSAAIIGVNYAAYTRIAELENL